MRNINPGLPIGRVLPSACCYPKKAEVNNILTHIPTATQSTGHEILHCKESFITHQLVIWVGCCAWLPLGCYSTDPQVVTDIYKM